MRRRWPTYRNTWGCRVRAHRKLRGLIIRQNEPPIRHVLRQPLQPLPSIPATELAPPAKLAKSVRAASLRPSSFRPLHRRRPRRSLRQQIWRHARCDHRRIWRLGLRYRRRLLERGRIWEQHNAERPGSAGHGQAAFERGPLWLAIGMCALTLILDTVLTSPRLGSISRSRCT